MDSQGPIVAVLTGDVVSSSELPAAVRSELPHALRSAGQHMHIDFEGAVPYEIDVFRGDSWQLVVADPGLALRVALAMRCRLYAIDTDTPIETRIGIGAGGVDFIPEVSVSEGDGAAFRASGRALEEMQRQGRLAFRIEDVYDTGERRALPVLATMVDAIANGWTVKQSIAVYGALRGRTQEQIGSEWTPHPITQQAVGQHLDSAAWNAMNSALDFFEAAIAGIAARASSENTPNGIGREP